MNAKNIYGPPANESTVYVPWAEGFWQQGDAMFDLVEVLRQIQADPNSLPGDLNMSTAEPDAHQSQDVLPAGNECDASLRSGQSQRIAEVATETMNANQ
jgi:hypothetical protein